MTKKILPVVSLMVMLLLLSGCASGTRSIETAVQAGNALLERLGVVRAEATPETAPAAGGEGLSGQAPAAAAPEAAPSAGPFEGTFEGVVHGDNNSSAPLRLELTHRGDVIAGTAYVGDGLQVAAGGFCGTIPVPATSLAAHETVTSADSGHFESASTIEVSGFEVEVVLVADLSAGGETLSAQATLHTPSLCATDPVLTGTLTRVE